MPAASCAIAVSIALQLYQVVICHPGQRRNRLHAAFPAVERRKQLRSRNLALLAALLAFVVLIYIVAIVRMGGS